MKIETEDSDGIFTVKLFGEIDHHSAEKAYSELSELLTGTLCSEVILELSGLKFMDSSGIALFLRLFRRLKQAGKRLYIESPQPQPMKVLSASGIERMIGIRYKKEATL